MQDLAAGSITEDGSGEVHRGGGGAETAMVQRKRIVIIVIVSTSLLLCLIILTFCYLRKVILDFYQ